MLALLVLKYLLSGTKVLAFTEPVQPRGISGYDLSAERKEVEGVSRFVQARGLPGLTPGNIEHISLVVEYLSLVVDYLCRGSCKPAASQG